MTDLNWVGYEREVAGLKLRCSHCRAAPGNVCRTPRGDQYGGWLNLKLHRKRLLAADAAKLEEMAAGESE